MLFSLLYILACCLFDPSYSAVRRFDQLNFDKWLDDSNFLVVLFCNSDNDNICVKEKEKLKQVSDELTEHKDLVFGYIPKESESILFVRFYVKKIPSVKLFPYGKETKDYPMNIRNADLKEMILKTRSTVLAPAVKPRHQSKPFAIPEIDWLDFESTVKNPEKHALLILYDNNCRTECDILTRVAKIFQKEAEVAFYKMNVDESSHLKQRMPFERNPTVFWYPTSDKERGFIYAGQITLEIMVEFINDKAGLYLDHNGELKHNAGRILEIDHIIRENIIAILLKTKIDYVIFLVEKKGEGLPHAKKFIDYYLAILREIKKGFEPDQIFQRELNYISDMLSKKTLTSSEKSDWNKFHNIVLGFIEFAALKLSEDRNKHRAELKEDVKRDNVFTFKHRDEL